MSQVRQYTPHNPESERCNCWSCCNLRLIAENRVAREKRREEARGLTQGLVISVVTNAIGKPAVYQFEIGQVEVTGPLREILMIDSREDNAFIVEAFLKLESAQRHDVLGRARLRRRVCVDDLWPLWDEEYAAEKEKR